VWFCMCACMPQGRLEAEEVGADLEHLGAVRNWGSASEGGGDGFLTLLNAKFFWMERPACMQL